MRAVVATMRHRQKILAEDAELARFARDRDRRKVKIYMLEVPT